MNYEIIEVVDHYGNSAEYLLVDLGNEAFTTIPNDPTNEQYKRFMGLDKPTTTETK